MQLKALFAAFLALFFSTNALAWVPDWHQAQYCPVHQQVSGQSPALAVAAGAPPLAGGNVAFTGVHVYENGGGRALDGPQTTAAVYVFPHSSIATNSAPNLVIDTKIQTQMTSRGWSRQNVDDVISDGPVGRTTDNRRPNKTDDGLGRDDTATVYGSSGNYVVVNDRTGEIVQVSGRNDPGWIDDGRIQWD